jgi:transmembrane sensor
MEQPVNKELLKKYLSGNCNQEELTAINNFFNSPGSKKIFDELMDEEWTGFQEEGISEIQLTAWNDRLKSRLNKQKQVFKIPVFFRYAAMWLIIIGLGTWTVVQYKKNAVIPVVAMLEKSNPNGQRTVITLSDSSVVYLGAGSKIRFPETFAKDKREVTLEGEAFFEVKHNAHQSFIVHTGALQTRDIGTSFKISAFKKRPVVIALASGEVRIEQVKNKQVQVLANLHPGQQSVWDDQKLTTSEIAVQDITGWKDGRLAFNGTRLSELTDVLERWYNIKFIYKNPAKTNIHMTITLMANTPIGQLMEVLSNTGHFKYQLQDKQIIIN